MKPFLSFVRKEFLHIFRDGRTMLLLLVMPVVMILLFGYAVTTEVRDTRLGVLDLSNDAASRAIIDRLAAHPYFSLHRRFRSAEEIGPAFRKGEADAVLVFSPEFARNLNATGESAVQVLLDGSEPNQSSLRLNYLQGVLITLAEGKMAPPIALRPRLLYNPQGRSEFNFVPGVIGLILLLICSMMAAVSIVREKELGTMEVLLASPLPPAVVILAKLVPYFVLSCINLSAILLLSVGLLEVPVAGNLLVFLSVSLLYIMVALALGLFISTLAHTRLVAMMISLLLILPTLYLSGMVFPIDSMPAVLQWISTVVPARWYVEAARKLMIQGVESHHVAREAGILGAMLCVILFAALRNFKIRLE